MRLYRLTGARYAGDVSGNGAKLQAGRWHNRGHAVVYASVSKALALLEVTVHIGREDLPSDLTWTVLEVPDAMWQDAQRYPSGAVPEEVSASRAFGTAWMEAGIQPVLRVPSALFSETTGSEASDACAWNALIHVGHPKLQEAGGLRVVGTPALKIDERYYSKMLSF